jgi:hypothetical protein
MTSVAPGYMHRDKLCTPRDPISIGASQLKWYDIGAANEPVEPEIHAMARAHLEREQPKLGGDLGFVVLHRCGDGGFYFLLLQTWLGNNEIWKTTLYKDRSTSGFQLFPLNDPHKATFCVWEEGAVRHEVDAWKRYLRSNRDAAATCAYLADHYEGQV